jgi:hypothetical protein
MSNLSLFENVSYTIRVNYPNPGGQPPATLRIFWSLKRNGQIVSGINFPTSVNFTFEQGIIHPSAQLTNVRLNTGGNITLQENDEIIVRIEARNIVSDTPVFLESSAIIKRRFPVPVLNQITLRNVNQPTIILGTLLNDVSTDLIGISLTVGGPNPDDFVPTGNNIATLNYQWKRNGIDIPGEISQQYIIRETDLDSAISVVVTATFGNQSTLRSGTIFIGDFPLNMNSRIGSHSSHINYWQSSPPFVNLVYSAVGGPISLGWSEGDPATATADGWPYRRRNGSAFDPSKSHDSPSGPVRIALVMHGRERLWSALGLTGQFNEPPVATFTFNNQGEIGNATYPAPVGIASRTVIADVSCFWEGQGVATASNWSPPGTPPLPLVSTILFNGPDGQGPFGDGPRTMSKSTVSLTFQPENSGLIFGWILSSDHTGVNPLRNLIVMVSNVRDAITGEVLYHGFDETTYSPFQLYPQWRDSMAHNRVIRSLHAGWAMYTQEAGMQPYDRARDASGNPLTLATERIESDGSVWTTPLLVTGWVPRGPHPSGFEKGFGAMNRPTNAAFGRSLRAYIEICNQLGADLWWAHPWPVVAVGTRNAGKSFQNGNITFAHKRGRSISDPEQVGVILVDEEYIEGYVNEIETYLRSDLKVYSEWCNEIWNSSSSYIVATRAAWAYAFRAIAEHHYGGDGALWWRSGTMQAPAINVGSAAGQDPNRMMAAFSAAASAKIAEVIRSYLGASNREVIAVASGQSAWLDRSAWGLGYLWASMPGLFQQLDAVAHAPYRPRSNELFNDALLETFQTSAGVWDEVDAQFRLTAPLSDSQSYWSSPASVGNFRAWKHLAIDHPIAGPNSAASYQRQALPPGWPAAKRRWNLQLLTYEGGNHYLPRSPEARRVMFSVVMDPRYAVFNELYMEAAFAPGPRGLARNPQTSEEESLYRSGMVPLGVEPDAEPLHDLFTWLITSQEPSYRSGMFWSAQWWNGHQNSPQAVGIKNAVISGIMSEE